MRGLAFELKPAVATSEALRWVAIAASLLVITIGSRNYYSGAGCVCSILHTGGKAADET